jgi:DNA-binding winged helix-turn-helix (wHTH) protein/Tol biopolymer transport system component
VAETAYNQAQSLPTQKVGALGNNGNSSGRVRFASFELDITTGELRKHGRSIRLQPQPSRVLAALVSRPGELVSRQELRHQIWDGTTFVDFEQGLNFCVRQIRLVLNDDAESPHFIETVPRRGYRFIAEIIAPSAALPASERGRTKKWTVVAYAGLAFGFLFLGLIALLLSRTLSPHMADPSSWVQLTNFTDSATSPALSTDGRMLALIRGPDTFAGPGQIFVKLLPQGEPVQLTHDSLMKMSPVFSRDGSRIAYTVAVRWDTWQVPTMGGEPKVMLPNASGLTWMDDRRVLFSEIKSGRHMGVVTAMETRTDARTIYLPTDEAGMAHRSAHSPDGQWLLISEMDSVHGWLPCRVLPFDGTSTGRPIGVPAAHCTSAAWSPDGRWMYFSSDVGGTFHIWRQHFPEGKPEQVTSGPTEEEGVAFAPDGRSFITSVGIAEGTVWVHDPRGDRQVTSEGYAELPSLSVDGTKLFYLARFRGRGHVSAGLYLDGDLWVADLRTNHSEPLLPSFPVTGYSVAPDGKSAACSVLDSAGNSHLWVAPLDRTSPPKPVLSSGSESEDLPIFASNGDLFFRASVAGSHYLFRLKPGGAGVEKIIKEPIIELESVSPDAQWAVAQVALSDGETPRGVVAYPTRGGPPVAICPSLCFVNWTFDGKFMYVHFLGTSQTNDLGKTFVVPVQPGNLLPRLPASGAEQGEAAWPGVKVVEGGVFPGPNASVYAFTKQSVHRNLYRIPAL